MFSMCDEVCSCCEKDICNCPNNPRHDIEKKIRAILKGVSTIKKVMEVDLKDGIHIELLCKENFTIAYSYLELLKLGLRQTGFSVDFEDNIINVYFEWVN